MLYSFVAGVKDLDLNERLIFCYVRVKCATVIVVDNVNYNNVVCCGSET